MCLKKWGSCAFSMFSGCPVLVVEEQLFRLAADAGFGSIGDVSGFHQSAGRPL